MNTDHVSPAQLRSYLADNPGLFADEEFAIEAHLERCARCRADLDTFGDTVAPDIKALTARVWTNVLYEMTFDEPAPARRFSRFLATWMTPTMISWLAATVALITIATAMDLAMQGGEYPPIVLLFAPVIPLAGVAAAWSRRLDPAHEVTAASARAGIGLVLRRTFAALVVVIPLLTIAGWTTGYSPAGWLLPCLACTAGALALGRVVGVARAAALVAGTWAAFVIAPTLVSARLSVALEPPALWVWAVVATLCSIAVITRPSTYSVR